MDTEYPELSKKDIFSYAVRIHLMRTVNLLEQLAGCYSVRATEQDVCHWNCLEMWVTR